VSSDLASQEKPRGRSGAARQPGTRHAVTLEDFAWLVAVPAAALTIVAVLVLGAPIGHAVFKVETLQFWPSTLVAVYPKPAEEARFLIALGGAVLVPLAVLWAARRPLPRLPFARSGVLIAQSAFVVVLVLATLTQQYGVAKLGIGYFTWPTIVVALLIGVGCVTALSWQPLFVRARTLLESNSGIVLWAAVGIAFVATVIWILPAIELDRTIAHANGGTTEDLVFTFDEGLTVLNGHYPLVNYVTQYGALWPYVIALPLQAANGSLGAFTCCMAAITVVSIVAMYDVIRRLARSAVGALLLFLPFMATSFFLLLGNPVKRYSFADYFGVFPLRYAGPFLVAFLLARHLSGRRPRGAVWVFVMAGLALLNNGDFGVPCLGATVIALVAGADGPRTRDWAKTLAVEGAAGLVASYVLVSILTLATAGALPNPTLLFKYAHLFALAGYYMLPTPWFGFWVVIYLTFAAALVVAATMAVKRSTDNVAVGMLAWIGIFGLGIGSYYMGRSHPQVLVAMFSTWSLAIAFLVCVTVRSAASSRRRLGPAQVALFVGLGLTVCSLAQFPAPWQSIERLGRSAPVEILQPADETAFVAANSKPGEKVVLLTSLGQRASREAGVDDVMPYSGILSMPTKQQLTETLTRLREEGGNSVYLRETEAWPEIIPALERKGFRVVAETEPPSTTDTPPPDRIVKLSNAPQAAGSTGEATP
jgi:hypothetical protein